MTAIVTQSAAETEALGRELGRGLQGGDVVALTGALFGQADGFDDLEGIHRF